MHGEKMPRSHKRSLIMLRPIMSLARAKLLLQERAKEVHELSVKKAVKS